MDTKLYIFGNGEVAEMLKYYFDQDSQYKVGAFVVDDEYCQDANFLELPLISWSEFLSMTQKSNLNLVITYKDDIILKQEEISNSYKKQLIKAKTSTFFYKIFAYIGVGTAGYLLIK